MRASVTYSLRTSRTTRLSDAFEMWTGPLMPLRMTSSPAYTPSEASETAEDERLRVHIRKLREQLRMLDDMKLSVDSTSTILDLAEKTTEEKNSDDFSIGLEYIHQVVSATTEVLEWQANAETNDEKDLMVTMDAVQNAATKPEKPQPKRLNRTGRAINLNADISASTAVV